MYSVVVEVPVGVNVVCPCARARAYWPGVRNGATSIIGPAGTTAGDRAPRVPAGARTGLAGCARRLQVPADSEGGRLRDDRVAGLCPAGLSPGGPVTR